MRKQSLVIAFIGCLTPLSIAGEGSDVFTAQIHQAVQWTTDAVIEDDVAYRAYVIGTVSCNSGTVPLDWSPVGTQHPLISSALYRLADGRLEQIGMSWLKHGYCAVQLPGCLPCTPSGEGCETSLGIGCQDPYNTTTNADQTGLGPRWQVNPSTGAYTWPFATIGQTGGPLYKRMRVRESDLDAPGALYFFEAAYIHPDDALDGNSADNASYRRATFNASYNPTPVGNTAVEAPAIKAWQDHGLGPDAPDPDVSLQFVDVPGDGRFWFAQKVVNNHDGTWTYEIAIENLNSDRAGGALSVPRKPDSTITGVGFHAPLYHSGEPFDNAPWNQLVTGSAIQWTSPQAFQVNPNTNALRFGTTYNYRFTANAPPIAGDIALALFKPGARPSITFAGLIPSCVADLSGDGQTAQEDLGVMLGAFGACPGEMKYVEAAGLLDAADPCVNQSDLGVLLGDFACQ